MYPLPFPLKKINSTNLSRNGIIKAGGGMTWNGDCGAQAHSMRLKIGELRLLHRLLLQLLLNS